MNRRQRIAVLVCGIIIGFTLMYTPFQILGRSLGYGWLIAPPFPYAVIDTGQLIVEWAAICLIGGLAIYLLRGDNVVLIPVKLSGAAMSFVVVVLRIVRAVFGLILLFQVFGLLPVLTWVANPAGINGEMLARVFIKVVVLLIFLGLFLSIRLLINWLHKKKYGTSHPSLLRRWAL